MSDCQTIKRRLADYCVGGLRGWRRARVEAHLQTCASCRGELAALERTAALITRGDLEAAPDHWAAVRPRLEARQRVLARPGLRLAYAVAAAAFALLVVFFGGLLRSSRTTSPPVTTPIVRAEEEVRASVEGHLAATWSSPLGDEAALGLRMDALEGEG